LTKGGTTVIRVLFSLLCIALIGASPAAGVDGNPWRQLSKDGRGAYVAGVVDAWGMSATVDARQGLRPPVVATIVKCLDDRDMPYGQVVAIVERHMSATPENWHLPMAAIVHVALIELCAKK
jgi:hypothetical protein